MNTTTTTSTTTTNHFMTSLYAMIAGSAALVVIVIAILVAVKLIRCQRTPPPRPESRFDVGKRAIHNRYTSVRISPEPIAIVPPTSIVSDSWPRRTSPISLPQESCKRSTYWTISDIEHALQKQSDSSALDETNLSTFTVPQKPTVTVTESAPLTTTEVATKSSRATYLTLLEFALPPADSYDELPMNNSLRESARVSASLPSLSGNRGHDEKVEYVVPSNVTIKRKRPMPQPRRRRYVQEPHTYANASILSRLKRLSKPLFKFGNGSAQNTSCVNPRTEANRLADIAAASGMCKDRKKPATVRTKVTMVAQVSPSIRHHATPTTEQRPNAITSSNGVIPSHNQISRVVSNDDRSSTYMSMTSPRAVSEY